ncbi:MAG: FtsX-like permease family protein, partial [Clostridiales bacterium]|nr:FtsX-like permease family protein [Clostridiales bacterium]
TKKGRTIITSFAGSIGIIGVALVLALSNGLTQYINEMQTNALSGLPISVSAGSQNGSLEEMSLSMQQPNEKYKKHTSANELYRYDSVVDQNIHFNVLSKDYLKYIQKMTDALPDAVSTISYSSGVDINLLAKGSDTIVKYDTTQLFDPVAQVQQAGGYWQELPDNHQFILSLYDLIGDGSRLPQNEREVVLVVDEYNRIDDEFFQRLGLFDKKEKFTLDYFIDKTILKVIPNNDFYTKRRNGTFAPASSSDFRRLYYRDSAIPLTITGILRPKEDAASSYLSPGIACTTDLTDKVVKMASESRIAKAQKDADFDVLTGVPFADEQAKTKSLLLTGASTTPIGLSIYPKDFKGKDAIKDYLNQYNYGKPKKDQVVFNDLAEMLTSTLGIMLSAVTYILVGFAAISLLVSTIMIGIITYVSVIERTKEIGILRSVGACKRDISRVFNAETLIVGFAAGGIGVIVSYLLTIPINAIIRSLTQLENIAALSLPHTVFLILGSMILTLIAGLIPSRMAAKKDPVVALRTE